MSVPVHRRQFDAFLSHAHADKAFADSLYGWLNEVAGLNIWYDAKNMDGGAAIGTGLQKAIALCRGVLLLGSSEAIERGYVQDEVNVALDERALSPDFRVIALRIAGANVADLVRGISWIDLPQAAMTADLAVAILRAFNPGDSRPDPRFSRDIYISASWQPGDNMSARAVCKALAGSGFRLIGDAKDQKGFKGDRLKSIIESCGAFAGIIPFRGETNASAADGAYKYFLREIDLAAAAGLPSLVIADARVHRSDAPDQSWLRMDTTATTCPADVKAAIDLYVESLAGARAAALYLLRHGPGRARGAQGKRFARVD